MCGICGIFHYAAPRRPVDRALLERMTRSIAHRGPDGEGFHVEGPVGLGHRRLAIVDLTPTGAQPMANEDGSAWITYNGEFYDHAAWRGRLSGGHAYRGTSDTETLLHLLEERGPDALAEISGIFAFAWWDARRGSLLLARDPLGVKQVYYHDDGERLLFASEVKALLQDPSVRRELDPEAVNQYLHFHTPLFDRTFFRGIRQLQPGEWLEVSVGGRSRRKRYWQVDDFSDPGGSPEENVERLRTALAGVVSDQLMSDVPVGAFFSAGIDSSAVAEFARRAGKPPRLFGVHFEGQGVIDEGPYQRRAAQALGLDLDLITLDGSTFPEDLRHLLYHQDQPVIGAAMLPMAAVSRLAAGSVKVCLGGQAGDEIFGGYARYALAHPLRSALSIVRGGRGGQPAGAAAEPAGAQVGGNLWRQLVDPRTLRRLARNAGHLLDWREAYFENFAKVPEGAWLDLFDAEGLVSRESCRHTFRSEVAASPARDPAAKVMHWDLRTYLPGLFQQDDRMSMAASLESRVPLADPRLVRLAFRLPFDLKIRGGATKWILRQAVADVLPQEVLTRRKVGFDTPAERWMKERHRDFVRDTLLSTHARHRGLWKARGLEDWLDHPERPLWFDVVWKALSIETWARLFLDTGAPREAVPEVALRAPPGPVGKAASEELPPPERPGLRDRLQEVRELGAGGVAFRASWEMATRSGVMALVEPEPLPLPPDQAAASIRPRLPFAPAVEVAEAMRQRIPPEARERLARRAAQAASGQVLCFGRWLGDYGLPPDWQLNPVSGRRWDPTVHWTRVLGDEPRVGDVKLTWEIGRFPHAWHMARAATLDPSLRPRMDAALAAQVRAFVEQNPYGHGVHWASGQEIVVRLCAWLFALGAFGEGTEVASLEPLVARSLHESAGHVERYLAYTRKAVYNNHLVAEALGLYLAGALLPAVAQAPGWRGYGLRLLDEEAAAQFYADGAYIQQSHNYERVALQYYLLASAFRRREGQEIPTAWQAAMERGLDFLVAQQNPADGRLPNHGSNDGALPLVASTCDYADFRPTLQAVSLTVRGERLYEPGPWDEEAAWLLGPAALDAPMRPPVRRSVSFAATGFHVLRGREPGTFATLRCGSLRDRFSQIDMLHLDVWWRGLNVLVDGGSYLYNGPARWHEHFMGTASHNTVMVDGRDQMLHYRRFKALYWTEAKLLRFENGEGFALVEGEHHGFRRHPGRCVHRRAVLQVTDGLWVVVDRVAGEGEHEARVHWLGGEYAGSYDREGGAMGLETPLGPFSVAVLDEAGRPLPGDVVAGSQDPPRGWLSRYYGEKVPVPSLAVRRRGPVPLHFVSVLGPGRLAIRVEGGRWEVAGAGLRLGFGLRDGCFEDVRVEGGPGAPGGEPPAPEGGAA